MIQSNISDNTGGCDQPGSGGQMMQVNSSPRLIFVAPPYLANGEGVRKLFPQSEVDPNDPQCSIDSASGYVVQDLSSAAHASFNLAMMSSRADVALIIVDAAFGFEKHNFWATAMAGLSAIPNVVLAIDNMALSAWSQERFAELKEEATTHAAFSNCRNLTVVPVDFNSGANLHDASADLLWYEGEPLSQILIDFNSQSRLVVSDESQNSSDQFAVHLVWLDAAPLLPGRSYLMRHLDGKVEANVSDLKHKLNPLNLEHQAAKFLVAGDIGYCNISLDVPLQFAPFEENRETGSFDLYDKSSGRRVAFGLIKFALNRATNIKWQSMNIGKADRALVKQQMPCVLWFTGLSGSGKSTIANLVEQKLHSLGRHTYVLDGDNVRHGLCRDLGFTDADRVENLRRISETANLFVDAGLIVLVSFISPFRSERRAAREKFLDHEFIEIFVDTSLEVCEARDPKGLYVKARAGELKNFTGLDSPYEPPEDPQIILSTADHSPEKLADMVVDELERRARHVAVASPQNP